MTFMGQEPKFFCTSGDVPYANTTENNVTDGLLEKSCTIGNETECEDFRYDSDMYTIVSEVSESCFLHRNYQQTLFPDIYSYDISIIVMLKGTATLIISMIYQKELCKPGILIQVS